MSFVIISWGTSQKLTFLLNEMLRPFISGAPADNGNPTGEEPSHPAGRDRDLPSGGERRPDSPGRRDAEKERRMEERKTKVLNVLSKLQDSSPRQSRSSKSRSNFEDCEFTTMSQTFLVQPQAA